ncbi:uncharacterized protein SPPG_07540 [Spizellomyces punctatus DAOM BR117]|uniref:Ubiquitin-conjugating enzyme E2 6 n=1 Tax=Spizellomyces punctatus (strain DAOM BR117) TaxID=645134 RepID=A0A0L0H6N6_SPIPD|nr:uncharacterized protein SPPG_07540 [Spizellomyces punctatus DAOM BR117]KNC97150.1 hypothetical protein SPPG_07540 [Spizellomyces punctatus DAOM BR117]|eukprot:XP_016605190.1 hypothetical protein SPPG_07540 [Spizellomyces punctatus DAOM BR117]
MASKGAHKRLTKEYIAITKNPPDYIVAKPLESNILEWHYVIRGPPDSPYEGGEYHGKVIFPADYPYKPPAIKMLTPNGRFQTDYRLCLSMSDYHPGTWNPAWSVATILTGLLSFMLEDAPTTGSIKSTLEEKRLYARKSHQWNLNNGKFKEIFPDLCTPELAPLPNAPIAKPPLKPALKSAAHPAVPNPSDLHRRTTTSTSSPSVSTSAATQATNRHAVGANEAGVVVANVWQNVRSNIWRVLLLVVFLYLVVLKVVDRVAEDSDEM